MTAPDDDETRLERDGETDAPSRTDDEDDPAHDIEVPWERLSASALRGVIEEFVTREGTEYGPTDVSLDTKVGEVRAQLERGEVVVLFHAARQTVNLARRSELRRR